MRTLLLVLLLSAALALPAALRAEPLVRTAALMQRPTEEIEDNVAKGRVALATSGLTALRGGAPLKAGGVTVGGIGIAGTRKEDDQATAAAVAAKDLGAP